MRFNIKDVQHVQGKCPYTADTLSTKLANHNAAIPTIAEEKLQAHIVSVIAALPASDSKLSEISKAQEQDRGCKQVKKYCSEQSPNKNNVEHDIKPHYQASEELTIVT